MKVLDPREPNLRFPHSGTFSANPVTMTAGYVAMNLFDREAVLKLNALTDRTVSQVKEVIRLADVPVSVTGAGSMFRFHLTPAPPRSYREAYQTKEAVAVINDLLDYMYFTEKILMINTFSCMFSTALTQKETDRLSEGLLRAFKALKPKIESVQKD
jgi:glutamate-1-semialdehyde 2,1-aminomutase